MITLTITSRGQITLREEVLQHLGLAPGSQVEVTLLPDSRVELKATKSKGSIRELRGFLKGKTNGARLGIDDINDAIAEAGTTAGFGQK